ncbi:uncharacterized protein PV09_01368 [Verruconis gallopava]|uniref:Uncharacterized protein n=1 Tax=Verruconis gallopava TaxID=253628 RepID=A0A0D2APK9_9PEZI|nr:uncharacterized protein PV09_01368 [Verruconis gallopava]KIW08465.1 hypothetical protein PV09_01368 [Verruconis gallopava]
MLSSTSSGCLKLLTLSNLLGLAFSLPLDSSHLRPRFSIVNVDGSSDPDCTTSSAPAVTQTVVVPTIVTIQPTIESPTETITVTVAPTQPPMQFWPHKTNSSSTTSSPSETTWGATTTSSSSPTLAPMWWPSTTPCESISTTTSSSSWAPSVTPCGDDDELPSDGAPWRQPAPNPSTVNAVAAKPTYSYPPGAHAPHPSGMTAPLPVLPTDAPLWYNRTQVPNYRKRVVVNE